VLQQDGTWPNYDDHGYQFGPAQVVDQTPDDPGDDELEIGVRLLYLINTQSYLDQLRDDNETNAAGQSVHDMFSDDGGPQPVDAAEFFKGKKAVLFGVPGAFTPTCSAQHLPGYIQNAAALKAKGVGAIACMSVNDAFVMGAWGKPQNAGDNVRTWAKTALRRSATIRSPTLIMR